MKIFKIVLVVISGLFLVSCESSTIQDITVAVKNPNYVSDIAPIFSAKCASCHSANGQSPPLNNYTAIKNAYNSYLCKIEGSCGSIMPPEGALPSATITMIKAWKESGFPENDTSVPIDPVVITNPKYSSNIEPIFSANCVVCHSANGQSPPLNNYTDVKKACQQDGVLCKIQWSCDNVMPPNNKMSQTTIDMIKLWIDQGYMN